MPTVLHVDDKPEIGKIVSLYMRDEFDIIYFDNAVSALAYLQAGRLPDLIITDVKMPGVDGFEFLTQLKSSEMFRPIPVFILSGIDNSQDHIRLLEMGAVDFIQKPFNPEVLKVRIKKWVKETI